MILRYREFPPSESEHVYLDDETVDKLYGDIKDGYVKLREIGREVGSTLCRVMEEPTTGSIVDIADSLKSASSHLGYTPGSGTPYLNGVIEGVLYMEQALKCEGQERARI